VVATWVGAAVLAVSGQVAAQPADPVSIHQLELEQHRFEPLAARILPPATVRPRDSKLERVVYGYYPFWVADLSAIRWSALTHLAWFSVDLNSSG
jgi:hypothetical protein